jgi:hypothetical protein
MDVQDYIPPGGFEERLLAELKAVMAPSAPRPSAPPDPGGWGRRTGGRLSRRALAGVAAAAVIGGTLTGGLVERQLGGVAAAPAVSHASLDAFLDKAAAAALMSKAPGTQTAQLQGVTVLRVVQYGPGKPIECQEGVIWTPLSGLLSPTYHEPAACPKDSEGHIVTMLPLAPAGTQPAPAPAHRYYPDLSLLPTQSAALRVALYTAAGRGPGYWGMTSDGKDAIVFELITRILESGVMGPPRAALYHVLEQVPGVSLTPRTADILGRPGTGITFTEHGPHGLTNTSGFILQAATYGYLGSTQAGYDWLVPGPPRYSSFAAASLVGTYFYVTKPDSGDPGH